MRQHTPGPWTVEHRSVHGTPQDDQINGLGLEVVGPEPAYSRGDYARAADANLIAAAPDLLEALETLTGYAAAMRSYGESRHIQDSGEWSLHSGMMEVAIKDAIDAIRKAKGEGQS